MLTLSSYAFGRGRRGRIEVASPLTLSNQKNCRGSLAIQQLGFGIVCNMERGKSFPLHSRNGVLKFLVPTVFRDSGKNNIIHQQEEEVIKGSCDHF